MDRRHSHPTGQQSRAIAATTNRIGHLPAVDHLAYRRKISELEHRIRGLVAERDERERQADKLANACSSMCDELHAIRREEERRDPKLAERRRRERDEAHARWLAAWERGEDE